MTCAKQTLHHLKMSFSWIIYSIAWGFVRLSGKLNNNALGNRDRYFLLKLSDYQHRNEQAVPLDCFSYSWYPRPTPLEGDLVLSILSAQNLGSCLYLIHLLTVCPSLNGKYLGIFSLLRITQIYNSVYIIN